MHLPSFSHLSLLLPLSHAMNSSCAAPPQCVKQKHLTGALGRQRWRGVPLQSTQCGCYRGSLSPWLRNFKTWKPIVFRAQGAIALLKGLSSMELESAPDDEVVSSSNGMQELWQLGEIDPERARFPCCIVWTPLPVVSWLAPYIGHVGIAREDGTILDFAGSNFVNVDDLAFGGVARCLQLDRKECCFPVNLATHVCARSYEHSEVGTAISWDDALRSGTRHFEHKCYNLFTCNSHSFVANCLNRLAYGGSARWNVLNLAALVWLHGRWLNRMAVVRSFLPFAAVSCLGVLMAGWSFLLGMAVFSLLLLGWFVLGVYCMKGLVC